MLRNLMASAAVALVLAAPTNVVFAATPPDMLVIGTSLPRTFDPADNNAKVASEMVANIYDTLVRTAPDDIGTPLPMLASEWAVSDDQRLITLTLRDDAAFHSGNPVTAADAAWSLQRVIKMDRVGATDFSPWGFTPENVDTLIRATGEHTIEIELSETVNIDLVLLSLAGASLGIIDSQTAMSHEADGDMGAAWLAANSAGSGPFQLAQWRPNELALFDANQSYWDGAPAMRRVAARHILESGSLRLQVEAGDLDIAQFVAAGDLDALANSDQVVIEATPGLGFYYIALNQKDPDLAKPEVREAFRYAYDWEAVAENLYRYQGIPWQSVIPQGMLGAPEDGANRYSYNPEKARELLAQAGYPNGISKVLHPLGPGVHVPTAEALQANAREAGIQLELVPGDNVNTFRERSFEVLVGNSGSRLADPFGITTQYAYNPDNSDEARLSSLLMWRVAQQSEELNQLVEGTVSELDSETRAEMFSRIDELYQDIDPALIIFFQRTDQNVIRANVQGYVGHPTWSTRWNAVTKD